MKYVIFALVFLTGVAESKNPQHRPTSRSVVGKTRIWETRHPGKKIKQALKKSTPQTLPMRKPLSRESLSRKPLSKESLSRESFFRACTASCGARTLESGTPESVTPDLQSQDSRSQDLQSQDFQSQAGKELEEILAGRSKSLDSGSHNSGSQDSANPLYVFISFSLHKNTLKELMQGDHVLVLRGLKKDYRGVGSWTETFRTLLDLGVPKNIIIDPTLFKKYAITRVPTFVLGKRKVSGNIRPKRALELMEAQ